MISFQEFESKIFSRFSKKKKVQNFSWIFVVVGILEISIFGHATIFLGFLENLISKMPYSVFDDPFICQLVHKIQFSYWSMFWNISFWVERSIVRAKNSELKELFFSKTGKAKKRNFIMDFFLKEREIFLRNKISKKKTLKSWNSEALKKFLKMLFFQNSKALLKTCKQIYQFSIFLSFL